MIPPQVLKEMNMQEAAQAPRIQVPIVFQRLKDIGVALGSTMGGVVGDYADTLEKLFIDERTARLQLAQQLNNTIGALEQVKKLMDEEHAKRIKEAEEKTKELLEKKEGDSTNEQKTEGQALDESPPGQEAV